MSKINCNKIKEEYYECLKSQKLGFDPELLKFNASKAIKRIPNLKINDEMMNKCGAEKLSKCLTAKYEILSINEKELYKYYQEKYDTKIKQDNKENLKSNFIE